MKRHMRMLPVFLVAVVALVLGAFAPELWAHGKKEKIELDEAEVFIEYNSTDEDLGIQFFWDGEPWKWMVVKIERGRPVLSVWAQKNVKAQGLTEGFFESAEPGLDELSFQEFLDRFPEGEYTFRGRTLDGKWLVGETEFTHDIPAPPVIISPEEEGEAADIAVIEWTPGADGPEIVGYEVVAEMVIEVGGEESVYVDTATFPAGVTSFTVSEEFVRLAVRAERAGVLVELKAEVIAREESGNKTITEIVVFEAPQDEE